MSCPKPEVLSQWADGSLDTREAAAVGRHAEACAVCRAKADELRAAGDWLATAGEPGPSCLSPEDMAAVLEGGRAPVHVRTCPRCAAELRALKPERAERKGTRRRQRPEEPVKAWVAAAAIFVVVGILFAIANRQEPSREVAIERPVPYVELPAPPTPAPSTQPPSVPKTSVPPTPPVAQKPDPIVPTPAPVIPESTPPPPPPVVATPEPPKPPTPAQPADVVEPARAAAALNVRSGGLLALEAGKWVRPARLEEGMALRADGRTQLDYTQARLTLDASTRFSVAKGEVALAEGGLSAEVSPGSKMVLVLDDQRIVPQTFNARVLFVARPDRIVIEEGAAKVKDTLLHEGVEHLVKKDRIEPQKRRTLPAAVRPREVSTRTMDFSNASAARKYVWPGRIVPEERMIVSEPFKDNPFFYGQVSYWNGGEEQPLFTVKPNTAIRFRYYLTQPAQLELVMKNITKDENFNKPLEPVVKQWTTVTLYARDIPANRGGKNVTCEVGDRYLSVGLFVGKPGSPAEVFIDRLEILEIDR